MKGWENSPGRKRDFIDQIVWLRTWEILYIYKWGGEGNWKLHEQKTIQTKAQSKFKYTKKWGDRAKEFDRTFSFE